jgi:hypothetical protein
MRPSARRAVDLGKEADHDWGVYFILFFLVLYLLFYLVVVLSILVGLQHSSACGGRIKCRRSKVIGGC